MTEKMTPAAVELAIEIRREVEARCEEADQLRCRAVERAQIEADLAQRRFMLVDPSNRLVADTLEREWNEKLRTLAETREERERARQQDHVVLDEAVRQRLVAMTTDFRKLWDDPVTANRERKRLLAYIIEDATLIKIRPKELRRSTSGLRVAGPRRLPRETPNHLRSRLRRDPRSCIWWTNCSTTTFTPKSPLYSTSEGFVRAHPRAQAERPTAFRPST